MIKYLLIILIPIALFGKINVPDIYMHCHNQRYLLSNWIYECNEEDKWLKDILRAKEQVYNEIIIMIEDAE